MSSKTLLWITSHPRISFQYLNKLELLKSEDIFPDQNIIALTIAKKKKKNEPKNNKVPSSYHLKNLHISYLTSVQTILQRD